MKKPPVGRPIIGTPTLAPSQLLLPRLTEKGVQYGTEKSDTIAIFS